MTAEVRIVRLGLWHWGWEVTHDGRWIRGTTVTRRGAKLSARSVAWAKFGVLPMASVTIAPRLEDDDV